MKVQINQEQLKQEWVMTKWYEKTAYVIGVIMSIFWLICLLIGVIEGISNV